MTPMTIEQLYEKLKDKDFQDTTTNLFYNYYVFQYDPQQEAEIYSQLKQYQETLYRPSEHLDILILNLFDLFCDYLKSIRLGANEPPYLEDLLQQDLTEPNVVTQSLMQEAGSDEYYQFIHNRIMEHKAKADTKRRPFVFLTGIGNMFPYLRAHVFFDCYEKYNDPEAYKIIMFYPGNCSDKHFGLFNRFAETNPYRTIKLLN